jgi:hypothetical protein
LRVVTPVSRAPHDSTYLMTTPLTPASALASPDESLSPSATSSATDQGPSSSKPSASAAPMALMTHSAGMMVPSTEAA